MNQLDYIAENQRLKKEIEYLKAFPLVSVQADALDLALQCAELKAELQQAKAERQEECSMCSEFKNNRKWLVPKGNGMYDEYTYQYCPVCGRRLGDGE